MLELTKRQARSFLLAHQGLRPPRRLEGKAGVLEYIRRVGCIQFDPLNVVGNNPGLVLQSRVAGFAPEVLNELLYSDRRLLDGWDKQMSIYCVEDWPFFSEYRERSRRRILDSAEAVSAVLPDVRQSLQYSGPLSSLDLNFVRKAVPDAREALERSGPITSHDLRSDTIVDWHWGPTRLAKVTLESMYDWGELIVHHKKGTRKFYDFAANHLPPDLLSQPNPNPSVDRYHEWHVKRRIGGVGLLWGRSGAAWLGIQGLKSPERTETLARLVRREAVIPVRVKGIGYPFYIRSEDESLLHETIEGRSRRSPQAAILAPLDNLLWDRELIRQIFGFDYVWEVYKPVSERKYGYYVLPVLYGDRFVARFEPGRDKRNGALVIKKWWWEPGVRYSASLRRALIRCFGEFLLFLDADRIRVLPRKDPTLDWLREVVR